MELTAEQANDVIRRLNELSSTRVNTCPICGGQHWTLNNKVWELREFNNGNFVLGGNTSIMPLLSLSCNGCGNTVLLNAIQLGAVPPQSQSNQNRETNNSENEQ